MGYASLRVFGSLCFPNLHPYRRHQFEFRSLPCVFLGYHTRYKGYRCLHVPSQRVYISRSFLFHESHFPYASPSQRPDREHASHPSSSLPSILGPFPGSSIQPPPGVPTDLVASSLPSSHSSPHVPTVGTTLSLQHLAQPPMIESPQVVVSTSSPSAGPSTISTSSPTPPIPTAVVSPPSPTSLVQPSQPAPLSTLARPLAPQAVHPMVTRSMSGSLKPLSYFYQTCLTH